MTSNETSTAAVQGSQAENAVDTDQAPPRASFFARVKRALRGDLECIHPRLILAYALLSLLPRLGFNRLRTSIYRRCGVSIGSGSLVFGTMDLSGLGAITKRLTIGADCQINTPLFVDLNADVRIGNNVAIGHHVVLITSNHKVGPSEHRCGHLTPAPIVIEDGCWVGARATILPGVTIGHGSIVSVGSVVSADVLPGRVVAGVPARPVKVLEGQSE